MSSKSKKFYKVPPSKRKRVEDFALRSACGNGIVANKGFRKPVADRFRKHVPRNLAPAKSIRELADELYRQEHGE
jgi:hypothetical protein